MNSRLRRIVPLAALLACGLLACTRVPAADSDRAALEAAIHRWVAAVNAQDVAALTSTMTEDVELTDETATVKGRDGAMKTLREVAAHGELVATSREIRVADDVAWHLVGLAQRRKNGDIDARGQALEIWLRVNGQWKLHRRVAAGVGTADSSLTRPLSKEPVLDRPGN